MALIKPLYPVATVALTCTLTSLASNSTLDEGRESNAVDNRTNLDYDHALKGSFTVGTSPTAAQRIEVWVAVPLSDDGSTFTWPDPVTGADANLVIGGVRKFSLFAPAVGIEIDNATNRVYSFRPVSIRGLFGYMPKKWSVFVTQNTGQALYSSGNALYYERIQQQVV